MPTRGTAGYDTPGFGGPKPYRSGSDTDIGAMARGDASQPRPGSIGRIIPASAEQMDGRDLTTPDDSDLPSLAE